MDILTESFQVDFTTKDDFIKRINGNSGCCICGENHETEQCSIFENLTHVKDSEVPLRAVLTLPKNLKIETLADGTKTIVATDFFPKGSQFGPFEGKQLYSLNPFANFPIKLFSGGDNLLPDCYLDTTNEEHCNWMCYVVAAHSLEEQNLICYQLKQEIYFSAIKDINPGDHLKVWYSPYYASKMGVNIYVPKEEKTSITDFFKDTEKIQKVAEKLPPSKLGAEQKPNWICKMCGIIEHNVVLYAKHLQEHYVKILNNSFICEICNEGFSSEKCLTRHKKLSHTVFTENKTDDLKPLTSESEKVDMLGDDACMPLPIDQLISEGLSDQDPSSLLMLDPLNLNENQSLALYNDLNDVDTLREILCDDNTKASKTAQEKSIADFRLDLVESETNSKMHTCDICNKQFQTLQYLCRHLKKHTGEYTCLQCLMVFTRKENYQKHSCFITNEKVFNCQYCSKVFLEKKYLVRHLARHDKKFKCTACGKQYSSPKEREQHNCPSVPLSEKKVYPCQFCKKNFYRDLYLRRHIKNFHESKSNNGFDFKKEKEVICEICAERFQNSNSLKTHMTTTHSDPKFECTVCSKKFHRKDVLENHLLSHGTPQLPCKTCGKMLKNKKSLDIHMLQHNGDKKYSCTKCGKKFLQKPNLLRHEATHLENTNEACTICNKVFSSKFAMAAHQKTHEYQHKNYKCQGCEKSFAKKHLLKKHFVHTHLDKVYSCPYCSRIFKHRNSIRRHLNQSHKSSEAEWNDPAIISSFFVDAKSLVNRNSALPESFIETNSFESTIEPESLDSNQLIESNNLDLQSDLSQSILTNNLIETDQQITLGKNAFILEDGTIVQPQEEGNVMIYVLDQRFSNIFTTKSNNLTELKNFVDDPTTKS